MVRAFRCNKCGDFHEGTPERKIVLTKPNSPEETPAGDLCEGCFEEVRDELRLADTHFPANDGGLA